MTAWCAASSSGRATPMTCWPRLRRATRTAKRWSAATERLSYRAFESAVSRCAALLAAAGVVAGDRVALLLGNGIAFPVVMFAALRLGAIAVPLSTREQTEGLAYMLGHSGAKLLVA